jgi:hypothetical protein
MKRLILLLVLGLVIPGCRNDQSEQVMDRFSGEVRQAADTTSYPLIVDGGTKIIYQFGHMTADKGLKLYLDTIPHPTQGLKLDESVRTQLSAE